MTWQVFLTPHTDDETIGMAGAITQARERGDDVMVVLVTDNVPSTRGSRLFAQVDHNIFQARRDEWRAAMTILGAEQLETWDVSEAMLGMNWFEAHRNLFLRIEELYRQLRGDVRAIHSTWGFWDTHDASGYGSISHGLCANALHRFTLKYPIVSKLFGVYVYSLPIESRRAPQIIELTAVQHQLKCAAMDAYRQNDHSIGYGFTSVPELFTSAALDPREYVIDISSEPR